jgi:RNA polymerase sigma-70 factor (ECF subfamily)
LGDDEILEALVRRESDRLLTTARRLLTNDHDAQDAVQEAFLQAHRGLRRFEGRARFSTWLHRIVVNAALMTLRSRRRKPERSLDELLLQLEQGGSCQEYVHGFERSSDELLISAETRAMVRRVIDRLPEPYREVLLFRTSKASTQRRRHSSSTRARTRSRCASIALVRLCAPRSYRSSGIDG